MELSADPNLLIPHYLMACYQYYAEGDPLLTDEELDFRVGMLAKSWDGLQHAHKGPIDPTLLKPGSTSGTLSGSSAGLWP